MAFLCTLTVSAPRILDDGDERRSRRYRVFTNLGNRSWASELPDDPVECDRAVAHEHPWHLIDSWHVFILSNGKREEEYVPPNDFDGIVDALTAIELPWTPNKTISYSFPTSADPANLAIDISTDYPITLTVKVVSGPSRDIAKQCLAEIYDSPTRMQMDAAAAR